MQPVTPSHATALLHFLWLSTLCAAVIHFAHRLYLTHPDGLLGCLFATAFLIVFFIIGGTR